VEKDPGGRTTDVPHFFSKFQWRVQANTSFNCLTGSHPSIDWLSTIPFIFVFILMRPMFVVEDKLLGG